MIAKKYILEIVSNISGNTYIVSGFTILVMATMPLPIEHLSISVCLADAAINDLAFSLVIAQL